LVHITSNFSVFREKKFAPAGRMPMDGGDLVVPVSSPTGTKDRNESGGAVLSTPADGTPITWISDQRNSDGSGMYRMDQQRHSGLA
jgi:hypothetical protein